MISELVAVIPAGITGPQAAVACTVIVCLTVAAGWLLDRVFN